MKKIVCSLLMMLACVLMTSCECENTPTGVTLEAYKCMKSEDYTGLVKLFYIDGQEKKDNEQLRATRERAAMMLKDKADKTIKSKDGIKDYVIVEEKLSDDGKSAKVRVLVTYGNDETHEETVKLVKTKDDQWFITTGK